MNAQEHQPALAIAHKRLIDGDGKQDVLGYNVWA